jgi:hypothetical protein
MAYHHLTRAGRRLLKKKAPTLARELPPTVVLKGDDGGLSRVENSLALDLLTEAIAECLSSSGAPVYWPLTDDQAMHFPFTRSKNLGTPWLAVALGLDGRIAVVTRRMRGHLAQILLEVELKGICESTNIPALASAQGSA